MSRVTQEMIDQTNEIAKLLANREGYTTPVKHDFREPPEGQHPFERHCWYSACEIQELLTGVCILEMTGGLQPDDYRANDLNGY